jgi:hypothetical protein
MEWHGYRFNENNVDLNRNFRAMARTQARRRRM